jgi:hypothetical protein
MIQVTLVLRLLRRSQTLEKKVLTIRFYLLTFFALVVTGCASSSGYMITEHQLPANVKGASVFAMVVVSSKAQGIESRGFQRRLETKLSSAGFRVVGEEERPDYIAMLTYGRFGAGEMLFGMQGVDPFFSGRGLGAGQGDVGILQSPSQQVVLELKYVNSGRSTAATDEVSDTSAFKRGLIVADTCREFSEVMDALLDSLFADFPGETASDKEVVDARLDPLCR